MNSNKGTVTNEIGEFAFIIPKSEGTQTILVSFIGYETFRLDVNEKGDGFLLISLVPFPIQLEEVIIKPIDPVALLQKAVDKIPENHIPDSLLSTAYFRYLVKQDSLPIHLEEFVFQSLAIKNAKREEWKRIKGRHIKDDEFSEIPGNTRFRAGAPDFLQGVNVFTTFFFRSPKSVISKKDYNNYNFELIDIITFRGRKTYVIEFDQNEKVKNSLFKGKIYLDIETLAFVSIKSQVSPRGKKYISKSYRYQGGYWVEEEDNTANYKLINGKWYLSDLSLYLKAYNFQRKYFTEVYADCMITDYETEDITPITTNLTELRKETDVWDLTSIDEFWNTYNYLKISDAWLTMARDIYVRNRQWEAKKENKKVVKIDTNLLLDEKYAIEDFMQKVHLNGEYDGSILIARGGEVIYKNAFGLADVERNNLNTSLSKFETFSVSKLFTATRIYQLVQEGKIQLSDKFMDYFPDYSFPQGKSITIRQLLNHTSGIPDFINDNTLQKGESLTEQVFMESLTKTELEFKSGTKFNYANSTYILLSFLIEKITGMSYSENLQYYLFKTASMLNSGVKELNKEIIGMSKGYFKSNDDKRYTFNSLDVGIFKGAGAVYSTSLDLLQWGNAFHNNKLLANSAKQQMLTPTPLQSRYAHGWSLCDIPSIGKFRGHIGGVGNNLRSLFLQEENNKYCIILLSNSGFSYESMDNIVNSIFQVLCKKECPEFSLDDLLSLE